MEQTQTNQKDHLELGLAFAGGLGPHTIDLIDLIIESFSSGISIDAQGQLRHSGNALLDPIDWDRAKQYLEKSIGKLCY